MTTNTTGDATPDTKRDIANPPTIRPLHDHILAQRLDGPGKTSGGLFIPDNAKEKPLEAVVIAVGSGKLLANGTLQPIGVKAGDKILIAKYSGSEVKVVGKDQVIVREDDVLGVIEDGAQ
jgi:chaperonin GroES